MFKALVQEVGEWNVQLAGFVGEIMDHFGIDLDAPINVQALVLVQGQCWYRVIVVTPSHSNWRGPRRLPVRLFE